MSKIKHTKPNFKPTSLRQEISRKIFHLLLFLIPLFFIKFGKVNFLKIFTPLAMAVIIIDITRIKNHKFNNAVLWIFKKIMREQEIKQKKLSGATWAFSSALICFGFFNPILAITGFCILIFADSMAAIIGKSIKSKPFYQKSRAGSLAFLLTSIIVVISCGIYFDCQSLFYLFAILIVLFITYLEAHPNFLSVDDNLLIPVAFVICMSLMDFMWHIL